MSAGNSQIEQMFRLTQSSLEQSIAKGEMLEASRAMKRNESQVIMDAASALHNEANKLVLTENMHRDRDRSVFGQLTETNVALDTALRKLNAYVDDNTSSTAKNVKNVISKAMPILPAAMYLLYEHLKEKEEEEEEEEYNEVGGIMDFLGFHF